MKERASEQKAPQRDGQVRIPHSATPTTGVAVMPPANRTGLPDKLKAGIEHLSGLVMDDVRVHYDSTKPAQLQAFAYTQGTEIYVAPGQEKHLPHEAWHVVQQKQRRVPVRIQTHGVRINNDNALEREADRLGQQAAQADLFSSPPRVHSLLQLQDGKLPIATSLKLTTPQTPVIQGRFIYANQKEMSYETHIALIKLFENSGIGVEVLHLASDPNYFFFEQWFTTHLDRIGNPQLVATLVNIISADGAGPLPASFYFAMAEQLDEDAMEDDTFQPPKEDLDAYMEDMTRKQVKQEVHLRLNTANIEKSGEDTDPEVLKAKAQGLGKVVDRTQPDVMMMQEVTRVDLFGPQMLETNLLMPEKGVKLSPGGQWGRENTIPLPDLNKFSNNPYPLSREYVLEEGAFYKSKNNFESNPILVNTATIFDKPSMTLYQKERESQGTDRPTAQRGQWVSESDYRYKEWDKKRERNAILYGKEWHETFDEGKLGKIARDEQESETKKAHWEQARPPSSWEINQPINPFGFRPAQKPIYGEVGAAEYEQHHRNLSHRKFETQKVHLLNVHTSPSISTIKKQVELIMEAANVLRETHDIVVIGGDFYMQKRAATLFNDYQQGEGGWQIVAPSNDTNYPPQWPKKEGGIADHFIKQQHLQTVGVVAIPPPQRLEELLKVQMESQNEESIYKLHIEDRDLAQWRAYGIDHAVIHVVLRILRERGVKL